MKVIDVTEADIRGGFRCMQKQGLSWEERPCPVMLACKRYGIDNTDALLGGVSCSTFAKVICPFMSDFDKGRPVSPFTFEWDDTLPDRMRPRKQTV
jgi:hypothetical protein